MIKIDSARYIEISNLEWNTDFLYIWSYSQKAFLIVLVTALSKAKYFQVKIVKNISKSVWILSLVSLFTDAASEMLYPIMPIYLKTIGFSIVLIGILEGFAEALAGLSKGYFGELSDRSGKRVPFVQVRLLD